MSEIEIGAGDSVMSLRKSVLFYVVGLVVFAITAKLSFVPAFVAFVAYFAVGFVMTRIVLRQLVEFHPMFNTLTNVSSTKLRAFLFWPVVFPILFFRLGVNKIL